MALISFDAALARLCADADVARAPTETLALSQSHGRVLAFDQAAPFAVPGFANSAMDGYAVHAGHAGVEAGRRFRLHELALAGEGARQLAGRDSCIEIATGAVLPDGADTVIPYEQARRDGDGIVACTHCATGTHVRGANDDYAVGQHALHAGRVLDAGALGVLASFGLSEVVVRRRPRIAVIVTGSELMAAGVRLQRGQIHDSNSATLHALLDGYARSLTMLGPVPDREAELRSTLAAAAADHDIVITAGGASAGRVDFVPQLLRELGEIRIWKVATRPGMPFLYGAIGDAIVYGLPGNPVSVFASMLSLVLPALRAREGRAPAAQEFAMLSADVGKNHARLEWRRGSLSTCTDGRRVVRAHAAAGSGMLRGVAESNALIRLEPELRRLGAGAVVEVLPFPT